MFLFAMLHPFDVSVAELTAAETAWIAVQCLMLQTASLLPLVIGNTFRPLPASHLGHTLVALIPLGFAIDVILFRWSGQHVLSAEFANLAIEHLPNLLAFFSWGMLVPLLVLIGSVTVGFLISQKFSQFVAIKSSELPRSVEIVLLSVIAIIVIGSPTIWRETHCQAMQSHITRHPWNSLALLRPARLAADVDKRRDDEGTSPLVPFELDHAEFAGQIDDRIRQLRMNVVVSSDAGIEQKPRPNVLIIVCESLRPEMLVPDVMPNAAEAARSGWLFGQHYSGGNATSLGMFSLLSGLEGVWFYKSEVRFAPPLNRLFRQAGYELGFFAGHDDWEKFQMDAFVSPQHYDRFEIEPLDWLASDRRAIKSANEFLRNNTGGKPRPPRLAVLFLYSTHAPFAVVEQHATDQPAATVAYPIPFPPSWRPSVWNRYRNAARTLDAELAELFHRDVITVFTGDHGESFLDDGTIGHGTKLSAVQTRVAAMICGPGFAPRQFNSATVHADVLPTLLAAAGIHVSVPEQFDGLNLQSTSTESLEDRTFSISNLVGRDVLVVPPHRSFAQDNVSGAVFGYQIEFSLLDQTVAPKGMLNRQGDLIAPSDNTVMRQWLERLTSRF